MVASGIGSLVLTVSVTADRSSRMKSVQDSGQIQPDAAKRIRQNFTVQMDNDPKQSAKAAQEFSKQRNGLFLDGQVSQQEVEVAAVKAWESTSGQETAFGDAHSF